jgi:hypothetical protein
MSSPFNVQLKLVVLSEAAFDYLKGQLKFLKERYPGLTPFKMSRKGGFSFLILGRDADEAKFYRDRAYDVLSKDFPRDVAHDRSLGEEPVPMWVNFSTPSSVSFAPGAANRFRAAANLARLPMFMPQAAAAAAPAAPAAPAPMTIAANSNTSVGGVNIPGLSGGFFSRRRRSTRRVRQRRQSRQSRQSRRSRRA